MYGLIIFCFGRVDVIDCLSFEIWNYDIDKLLNGAIMLYFS